MSSWTLPLVFLVVISCGFYLGRGWMRVEKMQAEIDELESEIAFLRGAVQNTVSTLRRSNIDPSVVADALEAAL